jgi:hypothetical protein
MSVVVAAFAGDKPPRPDSPLKDARQSEPVIRPPKERQRLIEGRGQKGPGISRTLKGEAADKLGAFVHKDRKTIEKMEAVVEAAEVPPGESRARPSERTQERFRPAGALGGHSRETAPLASAARPEGIGEVKKKPSGEIPQGFSGRGPLRQHLAVPQQYRKKTTRLSDQGAAMKNHDPRQLAALFVPRLRRPRPCSASVRRLELQSHPLAMSPHCNTVLGGMIEGQIEFRRRRTNAVWQ